MYLRPRGCGKRLHVRSCQPYTCCHTPWCQRSNDRPAYANTPFIVASPGGIAPEVIECSIDSMDSMDANDLANRSMTADESAGRELAPLTMSVSLRFAASFSVPMPQTNARAS